MRYRLILIGLMLAFAGRAHAAAPIIVLIGKGFQIYSCVESVGTYAWSLKGPKQCCSTPQAGNLGMTIVSRGVV